MPYGEFEDLFFSNSDPVIVSQKRMKIIRVILPLSYLMHAYRSANRSFQALAYFLVTATGIKFLTHQKRWHMSRSGSQDTQ